MADNVIVSNAPASSNTDIPVRTSETAGGKQIQHMRLDLGSGTTESVVSGTVPVSGTVTVSEPVSVDDNGASLTVDAASWPLPTGAATAALQLPDGHNVTVDNAAGAAAVNIQDGGNSITIDAASLPLPTGAATEATLSTLNGKVTACDTGNVTIAALPNEGQQTMANSISVAIASNQSVIPVSDNSTTLSVDDGAGSLTVDGTVAATQSGTWNIGTVTTVTTLTNITNQGQLVDNAAFTDGTTRLNMAGHIFDEVAGTALTENDAAAARIDSKRAQVMVIEDQTTRGRRTTVTAAGALQVDGSAVTQPVSVASLPLPTGAATSANQSTEITALQLIDDIVLAEDAAHSSGAAGVLALTRRADTASTSAGTDGDYATLNTNGDGRLHVADTRTGASAQNVQGPSAVGGSITTGNLFPCGFKDLFNNGVIPTGLDASGVVVMGVLPLDLALNIQDFSASGEVYVTGLLAHDAADSGGPIKTGGKAASYAPATSNQPSANKTAVASGDRTDGAFNLYGEAVEGVNPFFFTLDNVSTTYNNTTTTATSTAKDCWNYRQASFTYELTKANTPTDILFEAEVSLDGTNYAVMQNDFLGDLRESAASVGSGIKKSVTFPIAAQKIRIKATATGTTASATFTVANAVLYLRN